MPMPFSQNNYTVGMTTDGNGWPIPEMFLYGRQYQEIVLFNAQAILDTALHTGSTMTISTLAGQSNVILFSTLDQAVTVNLYIKNTLGNAVLVYSGSLSAGGSKVLTDVDIPCLKSPIYQIYATAQATVAPTTGALTATFSGVQG